MGAVKFAELTKGERVAVKLIEVRLGKLHESGRAPLVDKLDLVMSLSAVHAHTPLDLEMLAGVFEDFEFLHDIFGILKHIDRETGELRDCFIPRCAKGKG